MRTIKISLLPFALLVTALGCLGQSHPDQQQTSTTGFAQQNNDTSKIHQYGDYVLLRNQVNIFEAKIRLDSEYFKIKEAYPGILVFEKLGKGNYPGDNVRVEYYDINTKKLKTKIDLTKVSPYNRKAYENLITGAYNFSYFGFPVPPDSNCIFPQLPKPDVYSTFNYIYEASFGGYMCASFQLIKLTKSSDVVGWEQTFVIYNPNGQEIVRRKLNHSVKCPYVSRDGKYLMFTYGNDSKVNPFEPCIAMLEIYDIQQQKTIWEFKGDKNEMTDCPVEREQSVYFKFFNPQTNIVKQLIIDLDKKKVRIYQFFWDKPALPNWVEYNTFLNTLTYQTIQF